jgi:hypothetical protein
VDDAIRIGQVRGDSFRKMGAMMLELDSSTNPVIRLFATINTYRVRCSTYPTRRLRSSSVRTSPPLYLYLYPRTGPRDEEEETEEQPANLFVHLLKPFQSGIPPHLPIPDSYISIMQTAPISLSSPLAIRQQPISRGQSHVFLSLP